MTGRHPCYSCGRDLHSKPDTCVQPSHIKAYEANKAQSRIAQKARNDIRIGRGKYRV